MLLSQALAWARKHAKRGQLFKIGADILPYDESFWNCVSRSMNGKSAKECVDAYIDLNRSPVARFEAPVTARKLTRSSSFESLLAN